MYNKSFNRLPDNYSRQGQVNNKKLHEIIYSELEEVSKVFKEIRASRDIDSAFGKTLDNMGKNVMELRDADDDEWYRQLIKTKIIANLSSGNIDTINEVAEVLIGDNFQGIRETWGLSEYNNEPAGLVLEIKNQAKILMTDAIDRAVAGGVGLRYVLNLQLEENDIFVGAALTSGEEVTVYPYTPKEISSKGRAYIATGNNTGLEEVTVYPRKEVI